MGRGEQVVCLLVKLENHSKCGRSLSSKIRETNGGGVRLRTTRGRSFPSKQLTKTYTKPRGITGHDVAQPEQ